MVHMKATKAFSAEGLSYQDKDSEFTTSKTVADRLESDGVAERIKEPAKAKAEDGPA